MFWNFFKRKKKKIETQVITQFNSSKEFELLDVEWFVGVPYAMRRGDIFCKLLPGGKVEGPTYVSGWAPATEDLAEFYNSQKMN